MHYMLEQRMRERGVSIMDLYRKCYGTNAIRKARFYKALSDRPLDLTIKEVRVISVCLGLSAEEIYRTFILMDGWKVEQILGKNAVPQKERDKEDSQ